MQVNRNDSHLNDTLSLNAAYGSAFFAKCSACHLYSGESSVYNPNPDPTPASPSPLTLILFERFAGPDLRGAQGARDQGLPPTGGLPPNP